MFASCCGCGNRKAARSKALSSTDEEDSSVHEEEGVGRRKANGEENNGKISSLDIPSESQQLSKDPQDGNLLNDNKEGESEESAKGCEIDNVAGSVGEVVTMKSPPALERVAEEEDKEKEEGEDEEKIDESSESEGASQKQRHRSDASNVTVEESIVIRSGTRSSSVEDHEESSTSTTVTNRENPLCRPNGNHNDDFSKGSDTGEEISRSCLSRRSSSKSSMKKRLNFNVSTELIPPSDLTSINDDDEVFSDSVPPQLPRGDMCAPYLKKRGSMPGLVALPDWFSSDYRLWERAEEFPELERI